jgi:hypothetical protein
LTGKKMTGLYPESFTNSIHNYFSSETSFFSH